MRRLFHASNNVRAELQLRNIDQTCFEDSLDALATTGVLYAIIHLPSGKIYIGQTYKDAFRRFREHWYDCHHFTDNKSGRLHRLMNRQQIRNFLIWPLEKIDESLYCYNGKPVKSDFRRAADIRERF